MQHRHIQVNGSRVWVAEVIPDPSNSPLQPTIVLVPGLGSTALHYCAVQRLLPGHLRSFTYDRLGLGRSDRTALPRDAANLACELKATLEACQVPAPFLLVLHSYAGVIGREFLAACSADVAGIVMVDANQEHTLAYRAKPEAVTGSMDNPAAYNNVSTGLDRAHGCTPDEWAQLEAEEAAERGERATGSNPAAREAGQCASSLAALALHDQLARHALGTRPLSVIVANLERDWRRILDTAKEAGLGTPADHAAVDGWLDGLPAVEMRLAEEIMGLSTVSKMVVTSVSGHAVALWEPELVVREVGWCLDRVAA